MYVQKTFSKTFELLRENPINIVVYFIPQIAFGIVFFALYMLMYFGLLFGSALLLPLLSGNTVIIIALLGIIALVALMLIIAFSTFFALISNRNAYLTSEGAALQMNVACFSDLIEYAKSNFLAYLKNAIVIGILSLIVIGIAALPLIVLLLAPVFLAITIPSLASMALMVIFGLFLVVVYILVIAVQNTSLNLFFMGKESTGPIELVKSGVALFRDNAVEYVLMALGYIALTGAFLVAYIALYMTFCLIPIALGLAVAYQFGFEVSIFVFLSNLLPKK